MDPENDQLATFRFDLKHLTSLTSIPNIVLIGDKFLLRLSFIQYKDVFYKNHDFRTIDVNKTSKMALKFIILHFKAMHTVYTFFLTR